MSLNKRIGKIQHISVGRGGYQDSMFGVTITLGSDKECWGVGDFKGTWDSSIVPGVNHKWTEEERTTVYADTMRQLDKWCHEAKVQKVSDLKDIPVEVTLDGNLLKEWRILTEVI